MTETNNATLFAKIAKVMGTVRTLEKGGLNQFDKYDYVTADTIATRIGQIMADVGLAFLPSLISIETSEYTTKNGGSNFRTVAHFQMTLACTETGATFTSMWSVEAIDRSDKSISKAAVSAVKYYLLKTFLLAGGDEEDADSKSPIIDDGQRAQDSFRPAARSPQLAATNGYHDDALWEPTENPKTGNEVSPAQRLRLTELMAQFHGKNWAPYEAKWAEWASDKTTSRFSSLTVNQADKLIATLEQRIEEESATKSQLQTQ